MDTGLTLTILIGLLVVDYTVVGFIPMLISAWPKYQDYTENENILWQSRIHRIATNLDQKLFFRHSRHRASFNYQLVVTEKFLLIKNTLLTCLPPMKTTDISHFEIGKGFMGKKAILLYGKQQGTYLAFQIKDIRGLVAVFNRIGIRGDTA